MDTTFIYALCEPDTGEVRYIGKSDSPRKRFRDHLLDDTQTHKTHWIQSILSRGLKPKLKIIDEVNAQEWPAIEAAYIQFFEESGARLVNSSPGGEHVVHTKEVCAKISASKIGWSPSQAQRDTQSASMTGRTLAPEYVFHARECRIQKDDEKYQKMLSLRKEGKTIQEIADFFGMLHGSVTGFLERRNRLALDTYMKTFLAQPISQMRMLECRNSGNRFSYILDRKENFQCEMIVWGANLTIPAHRHPNVYGRAYHISGDMTFILGNTEDETNELISRAKIWKGKFYEGRVIDIGPGNWHGGKTGETGASFFSFQAWTPKAKPTAAGMDWEGPKLPVAHFTKICG